jgi:uncharacterized damage-inducible protein DinB
MNASEVFRHWIEVRNGLFQALDQLSDAQLDFQPRPGLWSLKETVCHIAGAEEGWFRYVVTQELTGWEEAEFPAANYPTGLAVKILLAEVHARTEAYFSQEADAMLGRMVPLPWGGQMTLGEVVWHVLEHEIHHRGEIFLMLGLMGLEAPDV